MQLRHRVAQRVVVPLAQLFMEVFDREAAVEIDRGLRQCGVPLHCRLPRRMDMMQISNAIGDAGFGLPDPGQRSVSLGIGKPVEYTIVHVPLAPQHFLD